MPAAIVVDGQFDRNFDQLRLGFLKGSNPSAFKRLASFATLNAARTLQKPMRDKAPRGATGNLRKKVLARKARFNNPAAVVGIKGGRKGVFYGYLVVGGQGTRRTTPNGTFVVKGVQARPFVDEVVKKQSNIDRAVGCVLRLSRSRWARSAAHHTERHLRCEGRKGTTVC